MSKLIKASPAYIDKDRAGQLLEKWGKVLDFQSDGVAPIRDDTTRLNTAILMENQQRWCLTEANVAGAGGPLGTWSGGFGPPPNAYSNDSYATGDYRLPKVLIPMIRRTFPELITNEIVGVQPMSGPVGLAFAIRYYYTGTNLGQQAGNGFTDNATNGSNVQPVGPRANGPAGVYYLAPSGNKELGWNLLDSRYSGTSSAQLSGNADFTIQGQDTGVAEVLRLYEMTGEIPTVEIRFEKTAVEAGTRRIAGKWSIELEQDLRNMNGIDIDNELTNAMSYEIQAEIDREMIIRMIQTCLDHGQGGKGYSFWQAASADARWIGERNRDFYAKLIVEANRIAVRNRRGAANFIIATPRVCAILEMLPDFKFMPMNSTVNTQPVGVAKVGTVGGRFTLYRDTRTEAQNPWIQSPLAAAAQRPSPGVEYALLGYKGAEYYDTGIVYCPYIPVMIQRTIGPNDFAPRVGIMTRYGVVDNLFGAELYYHLVIVKGLGVAFAPGVAHTYL